MYLETLKILSHLTVKSCSGWNEKKAPITEHSTHNLFIRKSCLHLSICVQYVVLKRVCGAAGKPGWR